MLRTPAVLGSDTRLRDLSVRQTWFPAHPLVVTSLGPHHLLSLSFSVCEMGTLALNLDIVPGQEAKPCLSQAWGGEGSLLGLSWGQQLEPTLCLCEGLRADGNPSSVLAACRTARKPSPAPQAQTPALEPRSGLEPVRRQGRKESLWADPQLSPECIPIDCVTGWGSSGKKPRVCLCTHVWTHGCTCICACTCAHMCACMCAHLCPHMCTNVCVHICVNVHVCAHECAFVCAHVHKCLYSMCTCVHVCVCAVSGRGRESRAEVGPGQLSDFPNPASQGGSLGGPWPPRLSLGTRQQAGGSGPGACPGQS